MDDLADRSQGFVTQVEPPYQRLERAVTADVRELGVVHIEAQLAGPRTITFRSNELEPRRLIDETTNQPGARDAIDVDIRARDPDGGRFHALWRGSLFGNGTSASPLQAEHRGELLGRDAGDELGFGDHCPRAFRLHLSAQPLEVFERLVAGR